MLTRIDHVGIACHDLAKAIEFYESAFGLTVVSREVNTDQGVTEAMLRVASAPAGTQYVQLLEPLSPETPVGRFLARRGEGIHHVGYGVADITAALASIGAAGVRVAQAEGRAASKKGIPRARRAVREAPSVPDSATRNLPCCN